VSDLFFRAFASLYTIRQVDLPSVRIRMVIKVPSGCGLGSSATAGVCGLVTANELLRSQGKEVSK
jgi:homoserine kinase